MGLCVSVQFPNKGGRLSISNGLSSTATAKVVDSGDGRLQEFGQQVRAGHVLSEHPDTFLCSSETMFVGCHLPHVHDDEELQLGQIYFLMPLARSNQPLSLPELCSLAIKASSALESCRETKGKGGTVSFSGHKSNRNTRENGKPDFQLALKQLHDPTYLQ